MRQFRRAKQQFVNVLTRAISCMIGRLYFYFGQENDAGGEYGKMYNAGAQKMANTPIALYGNVCYHCIIPVEYAYSTTIGIGS